MNAEEKGKMGKIEKKDFNCPCVAPRQCRCWVDENCVNIKILTDSKDKSQQLKGIENCPCVSKQKLVPIVQVCKKHGVVNRPFQIAVNEKTGYNFCPGCVVELLRNFIPQLETINLEDYLNAERRKKSNS